jgi:leader peptidase (prepilin peptidase) / N-methyltransferase
MVRSLKAIEMLAILAACLVAAIALFNGALTGSWLLLAIVLVTAQVIRIVAQDIVDFTVPDGAVVTLAVAGAVERLLGVQDAWQSELLILVLDAALCGLSFLAVREAFFRIKGFDGMGFGDVKLAAACGVLVGMEGFAWSVFAASALGLVVALGVALVKPELKMDRLPFGALLAPACWVIWLMQLWGAA